MVVSTGTLQGKHLSSESPMLVTLPVLSGFHCRLTISRLFWIDFLDRRCWFGFPDCRCPLAPQLVPIQARDHQ